jgi:xylan 1,4-beta-xylosidase
MFSKMGGERVSSESDGAVGLDAMLAKGVRDRPDVGSLASRDGKRLAVMVWHYHDDDLAGPDAKVTLRISGLSTGGKSVTEYRIDETHSNSFSAWKAMGSPAQPSPDQIKALEKAGALQKMPSQPRLKVVGGGAALTTVLPRQAVSLFVLE